MRRDKNLPINFMTKNVLKHKLKYSNCSGHVTDDFMSLLWLFKKINKLKKKKLLGRTLLSRKFSLPCDEHQLSTILGLVSWLFSSCSFPPLNFKCQKSTGYFWMPHTTKSSNMLYNNEILSQQQKNLTRQ